MSAPSREELRGLFLFEALSDAQLDWLTARGEVRTYDTGAVVYREGEPAMYLYVLVEGGVQLTRLVNGEELVVSASNQRGVYGGATRAYVEVDGRYAGSMAVTAPSRLFRLPGADFAEMVGTWFPMAVHLLDGLYVGIRNSEAQVRQREHLAGLGRLSANLAHELNNPAAATVRATSQLRVRVAGMRHKLSVLAGGTVPAEALQDLVVLQEEAVERAAEAPVRSPLESADLEDAVSDRLADLGVGGEYELAPMFVTAGLDADWVSDVASRVPPELREGVVRWLAYTLDTEALLDEVEDASRRISELVAAVKDYSHVDRATEQEVDLHPGLDSTLVMLSGKLRGITVIREYDRDLPAVRGFPGELNQVWTNLLDNAAQALEGRGGTVRLRTRPDGEDAVAVEVSDDGPGIAPEVLPRIWEPFFTTKPPGDGSGLGLDNARLIVERRHGGTVAVATGTGGTTFTVRLPVHRPPAA